MSEVQRLSETFSLTDANDQESLAQQPGAREGASLDAEQRTQLGNLVSQARTAGEQGDSALCLQRLTEVRAFLRQAGIGSAQPGSAFGGGAETGSPASGTSGAAGSAGSAATTLGGADAETAGTGTGGDVIGDTTGSAADLPSGGGGMNGAAPGGTSGGTAGGGAAGGAGGGSGGGSP